MELRLFWPPEHVTKARHRHPEYSIDDLINRFAAQDRKIDGCGGVTLDHCATFGAKLNQPTPETASIDREFWLTLSAHRLYD